MSDYYQKLLNNAMNELDADKRTPLDYPMWYKAIGYILYYSMPGGASDELRNIVGEDNYDNMIEFLEKFQPELCDCCGQEVPNGNQ